MDARCSNGRPSARPEACITPTLGRRISAGGRSVLSTRPLPALLREFRTPIVERWVALARDLAEGTLGLQPPDALHAFTAQGLDILVEVLSTSPAALDGPMGRAWLSHLQTGHSVGEAVALIMLGRQAATPYIWKAFETDQEGLQASLEQLDDVLLHLVSAFGRIVSQTDRERDARQAIVEERQRIARELHDSVAQSLYTITLYADAAALALEANKAAAAQDHLRNLRETAQEALRDMRLIIFELRPRELENDGLVAAIESRLEAVEKRLGLQTNFTVAGQARLSIAVEEEVYRIIQEALNNVTKHACASRVEVGLRFTGETVEAEVRDDGIGFDPMLARGHGGLGLNDMEVRARNIGGSLEISSAPRSGTRVRLQAPLAALMP